MKILITGGIGFIFSYCVEYFVQKGYEVVVIDNKSEGSHPEIIDNSFKFYYLNAESQDAYNTIIEEKPDYVIHAAAISDVDYSIKESRIVLTKNIQATLNVFEACKKINFKKLIYISTDEVYGECEYRKKETDIIFPRNPYSCSKAVGSLIRVSYDNTYSDLFDKTAEIRFCNIFGGRQDQRKIIPNILKHLKEGTELPVHNNGQGYREYLYVKNIPEVVELVMLKGNRVYNITLNEGFTVNHLIKEIERNVGKKIKTKNEIRQGMDLCYIMDNQRIIDLGWKPKYNFEEGLKDYVKSQII